MAKFAAKSRAIDEKYLEEAALAYLARYASSSANLQRVLLRKVDRARLEKEERARFAGIIARLIERLEGKNLLNDKVYAESRIASLQRSGLSARAIRGKLIGKGVKREILAEADFGDRESDAALAYAKRKRLGPFRVKDQAEHQERDFANMMRGGFDYDVVRALMREPRQED